MLCVYVSVLNICLNTDLSRWNNFLCVNVLKLILRCQCTENPFGFLSYLLIILNVSTTLTCHWSIIF